MTNRYGIRYMKVDQFVSHCKDLKVEIDKRELEHYEKVGIMLPVARVIYPEDYVQAMALRSLGIEETQPNIDQWPEVQRLSDKRLISPQDYATLHDDELIDSFDREMGSNLYLTQPTTKDYKPWDSYTIRIPYKNEQHISRSTADHYYSYWQVHQLYYIQQFPDLYKNRILLEHIPDEIKRQILRPWSPNQNKLLEFKGLAPMFDALSFWITIYNRERHRAFALIPETHQVKQLDTIQSQGYQKQLKADAQLLQTRYVVTIDDLYGFLFKLIDLYNNYRRKERYKLADDVRSDIIYQAQLIEALSGDNWNTIAEELGQRFTFWTRESFRHLDSLTKERDEAREVLIHSAGQYKESLTKLKISSSTHSFSTTEIDEFLDYCESEGFSLIFTALHGMIATEEEYAKKFRRVNRYSNIKNILTALEFLLKDFADKAGIALRRPTLNPTIQTVLKNETGWISLFEQETKNGSTSAKNLTEFLTKLNQLINDPNLKQSEDTYWARIFLIASLSRNLTVHLYPNEDWFYGELFGEMLKAGIYAILYSWQVAKREGWV